MGDFFVKLAYKTESSKTHFTFIRFLENILQNHHTKQKKIFDFCMIFLVFSTVGILIYEVKHEVPIEIVYYEYFAVAIFILEWLGRYTLSFSSHRQIIKDFEASQYLNMDYNFKDSLKTILKKKLEFIFSPSSIIDLLAILPTFRPLRILRILLLLRLLKILNYTNSINQFIRVFAEKKLELTLLFTLYCLIVFFAATVIYVFESNGVNKNINTYFDAIYWAFVTLATIGYGDITPQTEIGRVMVYVLIIAGLAAAAFFTAIVTSAMTHKLEHIKTNKTLSTIRRHKQYTLVCGYGRTSRVLVQNLIKNGHKAVVIESNAKLCEDGEKDGIEILKGDSSDIELLEEIGIMSNISNIVILHNDDTINLSVILSIRSINKKIEIISRCNSTKSKNKLLIAGANEIIRLNDSASLVALGYLKNPIAYEAIDDILTDHKGAIINEIEIFKNSYFIGKALNNILFDRFNITFIGICHNEDKNNLIFNPNKNETVIKEKDFLIVIGYEKTIHEFKLYLQAPHKIKGIV